MQISQTAHRKGLTSVTVVIALASFLLDYCLCIRFHIQPHQKKCLKNEMHPNQLAVGEYEISSLAGTTIDMTITDSKGHKALNRDNVDGKVPPGSPAQATPREIYVDFKVGAEAKSYDSEAGNKLSQLGSELNRLEDLTNAVITDFAYLKKREQEMRDTNESTNTRIFYQSVTSVIILLVLATWQVLYLRNFFKARKLID